MVLVLEVLFWSAAALVAYSYIGYPALLALLARLRPAPAIRTSAVSPTATILIVVCNEEQTIEAKLESCLALDYPKDRVDILVVSDGSTDLTVERARRFGPRGVRVLELPGPRGKAAALNQAVPLCRSEILLFTDARQSLAPDSLRHLVANFADPTVGAASGELHLVGSDRAAGVGFYWTYEKLIRRAESRFDSTVGVTGALYALRRSLFVPLDPRTILDDVSIPMQVVLAGYRVVFEPRAQATDHIPDDLSREYRRKVRTLAGNYQLPWLHPAILDPRRNRLFWQFASHKLARLAVPWCLLIMLLASALTVARGSTFQQAILVAQLAFYGLGLAGAFFGTWSRLFSFPYTFLVLNAAAARALIGFLAGSETAAWKQTPPRRTEGKLVVVLSKFPCYDEAFLLREIAALSSHVDLHIFSLRSSRERIVHEQAVPLLSRTISPRFWSWALLRAQVTILARRPRRLLNALASLVAGNARSPVFLVKNLVLFPKAVYLAQWVLDNGATHIHAGWATFPTSAARVVSQITGATYSLSAHAHDIYLDTTHLDEKIRGAAFVTTCTEGNGQYLAERVPDYPSARLHVLHHGVSLTQLKTPPRTAAGPFEILSVGTLQAHKGFNFLLEALERLSRDGLDFRCTIVGGGPLASSLATQTERLGLADRVTFTGPLPQAQVIPHYKRAHAFVLMAQAEWHWGIPNVIVEALAAHNAVVTTRFGSVEELIKDGETGVLVPAKQAGPLADALRLLASDTELRLRLARAGHEAVVRGFDLDKSVEAYTRLFRDLHVETAVGSRTPDEWPEAAEAAS